MGTWLRCGVPRERFPSFHNPRVVRRNENTDINNKIRKCAQMLKVDSWKDSTLCKDENIRDVVGVNFGRKTIV